MSYSLLVGCVHFCASPLERNRELGGSSKVIERMKNKSLKKGTKEMDMNLKESERKNSLNWNILK